MYKIIFSPENLKRILGFTSKFRYDWITLRPEFFYELIYGNFFSDLGSGGRKKKKKKKSSENPVVFFLSFSELFFVIFRAFFLISRKNSKTSKANQQSVLIFSNISVS